MGTEIKYLALIGLGQEKKGRKDLTVHSATVFGRKVAKAAQTVAAKSVAVVLPELSKEAGITQVLLGIYDSSYQDLRFKKETNAVAEARNKGFKELSLLGCETDEIVDSIKLTGRLSKVIASGVDFAKDLVGESIQAQTGFVTMISNRCSSK